MSRNTFRDPDADYRMDDKRTSGESFVIFGTAFPEQTEKDKQRGMTDSGQFVPLWKQEARDEKGRRRFHGAFTGGFSAGYFNTEIAGAKKLVATEEFDILGGTERELAARRKQKEEEERGGALGFLGSSLMNIVGPTKESIGIRLLGKMGWKPGQGIGPRMSHKQRQALYQGNAEVDEDGYDDHMANVTFAPRDTPIVDFSAKTNTYGLGYDLGKSVHQVAEMRRLRELKRDDDEAGLPPGKRAAFGVPQSSSKNAGFGLGTFEDDDEDYEVYGDSAVSRDYHHLLYDEDEDNVAEHRAKRKKVETLEKTSTTVTQTRCTDGRPAPRGYVVSTQSQELGNWHPPPKVPAEFSGRHIATDSAGVPIEKPQHGLNADQRGLILGEKPIEQRSVFDFIPAKAKDKLDSVLKFMTDETLNVDKTKLANFPTVTKEVANLALRGFMPFGDNPKKQERYRHYLENMAGLLSEDGEPKDTLPLPEGLVYEAGMKEMDEFAKAARIFRPISAMMSGRFTSARTTTVEQTSFEGGLKTEKEWRKEKSIQEEENALKPEAKEQSQEAAAASMKMFGRLTRTVRPFYPCKLLCKRFNVRNPHPNHDPSTVSAAGRTQAGSRQALSEATMDTMLRNRKEPTAPSPLPATRSDDPLLSTIIPKPSERPADQTVTAPSTPHTLVAVDETKAQAEEEKEEEKEAKPVDYERPSMDIFKAIFEDTDDEDEDEEQQEEPEPTVFMPKKANSDDGDEDMFIGPPPPPPLAVKEPEAEPFRPMFSKPSERPAADRQLTKETALPLVKSEQVVVSHFKPRERTTRRHVSVSDEDSDTQDKDDRRSKKKHKESKSRKRSRSPERTHRKKDKKDRKEKKEKRGKSRRHRSSHTQDDSEEQQLLLLDEAEWVEKEPQLEKSSYGQEHRPSSRSDDNVMRRPRMRASDLW
ncbi:hypothetical protein DFQ28_011164 [Apophysomyces sp. BC1034]|nr:hypothetical protein DFQ29_009673 [Apophysomyces sp. BC1021]KAG0184419.1 hypothetical protein DFQ28_011164 [Apophysomyces sp. BC1034]